MSDLSKIIEDLSKLTVVEAAELSKQLEEKWGVSAAVAAAPAAAGAADGEEKSEFTVFLSSFGEKKINVIKEVRAITGLGLKEARGNIVGILNASAQKLIGILLAQSKKMANLAPAEENKK